MAENEIRIGVLATRLGPLAFMGEDAIRGTQLAIAECSGAVSGRPIRLFVESTNAVPDSASEAAEKLIERDRVAFTVGPLSGNEGIALREYAKTRPEHAFLNGTAANQTLTLHDVADNFFNFSPDGVQSIAGLGTYAYEELGYRRVVVIGENYSFPHAQIGGFMIEFCRLGGKVVRKFWVSLGTSDYHSILEAMPHDVDAILIALVGADITKFLHQYAESGLGIPILASTAVGDRSVIASGDPAAGYLVGSVSAGPTADENGLPSWDSFVGSYRECFPDGLGWPSLFAFGYYLNTKAALLALHSVNCDLSHDQAHFKEALRTLTLEGPTGPLCLNHNRQANATIFIRTVDAFDDGTLYTRALKIIPDVDQMLGMSEAEYLSIGEFTADNPGCG